MMSRMRSAVEEELALNCSSQGSLATRPAAVPSYNSCDYRPVAYFPNPPHFSSATGATSAMASTNSSSPAATPSGVASLPFPPVYYYYPLSGNSTQPH